MSVIVIPNVSEGRSLKLIAGLVSEVASLGASVLDVHSDPTHHRSVLTISGEPERLVEAMVALAAQAAERIDLTRQQGLHPRVGCLDVCPFVPLDQDMDRAVRLADETATGIGAIGLPVFLYGEASPRPGGRDLPSLRKGGLEGLAARMEAGDRPDHGPSKIDPRKGVVCVGARRTLIAFNVWIHGGEEVARTIAQRVRTKDGGAPGIRALGIGMSAGLAQISMNLIDPDVTGIDAAFEAVRLQATIEGVRVMRTELVGLVPERYMPARESEAARLMSPPSRSLEAVLRST